MCGLGSVGINISELHRIYQKMECLQFIPPTDLIFLPLTRAWGAEGCDEAGWGEAESHPEAGARVFRGLSHKTYFIHNDFCPQ